MFKNSILRYLNSAAVFDAESDARAAVEAQRKSIKVESVSAEDDKDANSNAGDNTGDDNSNTTDEADPDEDEDEPEEPETPENETDEQKQERLAKEKEDKRQARMQRRIDKLTAEKKFTEAELAKLQKQIAEKPVEGLTEEEVQRRAEKLAADIVKQREQTNLQDQFQKDCDKLQAAAVKVDKEFNSKIAVVAQEVAPIPAVMIGILNDLDNENGGAVLTYLANNVDEYEGMFRTVNGDLIALSEGKMTAKLIRISDKLKAEEAARKAKKKPSALPEPITPVNEGRDARTANVLPSKPTENMDDYVRIRNEQEMAKRKARGY